MNETNERVSYTFEVNSQEAVKDVQNLIKSFTDMNKSFKDINTQSNNLSSGLKKTTNGFRLLKTAVKSFVGIELGKFMADAAKNTIDYYETLNLFQVAMKGAVDEGNTFIATMQEMYGLDPKNLMEYTGLFYEMAYAVEAPQEAAQILSTSLTGLTVDLASLYNVDIDKVASNLMSGMRGMSRAVLKYGLDLRATTVEAYANAMGITENYETMNEASREILRYLVAVKQARDAVGDFANTQPNVANQLRIFKEQVSQLGRAIGWFIIEPLAAAMPYINGFVMALRTAIELVASLAGVMGKADQPLRQVGEDGEDALEGIAASAKGATKQVKSLLAPFDELNILKENKSGSGSASEYGAVDPKLLELLRAAQYELQNTDLEANKVRDSILKFFGIAKNEDGIWEFLLLDVDAVKQKLTDFGNWFAENKKTIVDYGVALAALVATIGAVGLAISGVSSVVAVIGGIKTGFAGLITTVGLLATKISGFGAPFAALVGLLKGFAATLVATFGGSVATVVGLITALVASVAVAFVDLMANNDQFRENFVTLIGNIGSLLSSLFSLIGTIVTGIVGFVRDLITTVSDIIKPILPFIMGIINAIVGVLDGVVKFLHGQLTGDIKLACEGLKQIFTGLFEAIGHVFVGIVNGIMTVIATLVNAVGSLIYAFVDKAFDLANAVAKVFGHEGWQAPSKESFQVDVDEFITVPKINDYAAMATGGVVTAPTRALIGEAGRSEAVIPLDNSPQMQNFISQIVDAIGANNNRPVEARVYLDGKSLSRALYNDMQSEGVRRGKSLVTTSR